MRRSYKLLIGAVPGILAMAVVTCLIALKLLSQGASKPEDVAVHYRVVLVKGNYQRANDDAQLPCALLSQNAAQTDFWVTVGQVVEVTGYAEHFGDRWQLYVVEAQLVQGDRGWPVGFRYRSARRIVAAFNRVLERLFGPPKGYRFLTGTHIMRSERPILWIVAF